MKKLLNLPWALSLSAITSHHLALAIPAGPVGSTAGTATIVQPGSGSARGNVAYALPNGPALNITNAFSGIGAVSSGFPPGPSPPKDVTFYEVPDSNPLVTLKLQDFDTSLHPPPWGAEPGRNETATNKLLDELLDAYSIPADTNDTMTDHEYDWEEAWRDAEGQERKVYVYMQPVGPDDPGGVQGHGLIEGNWANTIRGLQDFLHAYPGLAVRFDTWVYYWDEEEGEEEEFRAATGHLRMEPLENAAKVDVTS